MPRRFSYKNFRFICKNAFGFSKVSIGITCNFEKILFVIETIGTIKLFNGVCESNEQYNFSINHVVVNFHDFV